VFSYSYKRLIGGEPNCNILKKSSCHELTLWYFNCKTPIFFDVLCLAKMTLPG